MACVTLQALRALGIVARDLTLTVFALGGILHQELYGPVKWELLLVYTTVLSVPGVANILALRSGSGIGGSPQPQPPAGSSPGRSSSSPTS